MGGAVGRAAKSDRITHHLKVGAPLASPSQVGWHEHAADSPRAHADDPKGDGCGHCAAIAEFESECVAGIVLALVAVPEAKEVDWCPTGRILEVGARR